MKEVEEKFTQHIEAYTDQCVGVLTRFIGVYENTKVKTSLRLECICEVHDSYSMSLTFMGFPDMSNYCQVLGDKDNDFMKKPTFLNQEFRDDFMSYLVEYLEQNDIDEDEEDAYDEISSPLIIAWLSHCWIVANQMSSTQYNLFYFSHSHYNQPAINLLNRKEVFLGDLVS